MGNPYPSFLPTMILVIVTVISAGISGYALGHHFALVSEPPPSDYQSEKFHLQMELNLRKSEIYFYEKLLKVNPKDSFVPDLNKTP